MKKDQIIAIIIIVILLFSCVMHKSDGIVDNRGSENIGSEINKEEAEYKIGSDEYIELIKTEIEKAFEGNEHLALYYLKCRRMPYIEVDIYSKTNDKIVVDNAAKESTQIILERLKKYNYKKTLFYNWEYINIYFSYYNETDRRGPFVQINMTKINDISLDDVFHL